MGLQIELKIIYSVLLLVSLTLIMNMTVGHATTVNQITINSNNITNNTVKTILPSTTTQNLKITASADPVVVNNLTLAQLENGILRVDAFYNTNGRLPTYVSYGSRENTHSNVRK